MAEYEIKSKYDKMKMSYNRLWKLLIDKKMKKSDLRENANINSSTMAKLSKYENMTTDIFVKSAINWTVMFPTSWNSFQIDMMIFMTITSNRDLM